MTTSPMRTGPGAGTLLDGRYRLMQRVGSGGMADVWSARDEVLERVVAVKLFRFDTTEADERRIQNEIRTVAALSHPGIVTVFDAGTVADPESDGLALPYLVMEYVPGQTLANRIRSLGPLYEAETRAIGLTVAETLAYVHDRGVIHRDIKPANLLLPETTTNPAAKITDFGIARMIDSAHHTATGLTVGTPNYLAPEQATGSAVGFPADIYSLGLVLLECLTGTMAYPGTGVEAALARLHRQPSISAALPAPWPDLLAAMTAQEPGARPSAADVVEALGGTRPKVSRAVRSAVPPEAAATALMFSDPMDDTGPLLATGDLFLTGAAVADAPEPAHAGWGRRKSLGLTGVGALAVAGVVAGIVLSSGGHGSAEAGTTAAGGASSAATTPAAATAATYASVSGRLGQDLAALELTVAPERNPGLDATTRQLLSVDLMHVATAAAQHRYSAAKSMLAIFLGDLNAARATGKITAARGDAVRTAAATVEADLTALLTPDTATPTARATTKAAVAPPPAKAPAPAKAPIGHEHAKHRGKGKG